MKWISVALAVTIGMSATMFSGCGEDDSPPAALTLVSLTAGAIDLNGASSATGIPVSSTIVAEFSTEVNDATIEAITMMDYESADVALNITVDGKTVTIDPTSNFAAGAQYILNIENTLASVGGTKVTAFERSFTTEGQFVPNGVIAHFSFEDNVNDVVGSFDPTTAGTDVTFVSSRKTAAGKAASFNGTTTIVEVPNGNQLMSHGDFAVSFWVKVDGSKESHFVFGLGAWYGFQFEIMGGPWTALDKGVKLACRYELASSTDAEDTWWNGNPNGWQGSEFAKDVSGSGGIASSFKDVWAHVVCGYDKETKVGTMYVNGEKVRQWNFTKWPDGDAKKAAVGVKFAGNLTDGGNNLALGFIQASGNKIVGDGWADPSNPDNNHFKGQLDDLRFYSTNLSAATVSLMYNSEKP